MKMTNAEMCDAIAAMMTMEERGALGLAIAKNLRKLREESQEYLKERDAVLIKYGDVGARGRVEIPEKNQKAVDDELKEMAALTADVEICKVPEEVFVGGTLTSKQMAAILWMMEEDNNENA